MKNKVWIKYYVGGVLNETITFKEAQERINKKKKLFIGNNFNKGERVVVRMNNSIDTVINFLALSQSGIIAVPVSPFDSKVRIDYIIKDCKPTAIIMEDGSINVINQDLIKFENKEKINTIIYTSGTTGEPKGVCLSMENWINNANSLIKHHKLDNGTVLATPLPIFHCNAHGLGMYATYLSESTLILFDKTPDNFLDIINTEKVNVASIVPSILSKLLKLNENFKFHKNFNYFLTAAAPLSESLLRKTISNWNVRVIQGYGLTESTNFSCTLPIKLSENDYKNVMFPVPSIGVELNGVSISLKQPDKNGVGELVVNSKSNSLGYWDKNVQGRDVIETGDLGYIREINDKRFFYLKGRIKELINRSGEKIYPLELESEIRSLGLEQDFHIIPIDDNYFGEDVSIVLKDEFDFSILSEIPYFRRPKKVFKVSQFITTSTGKIQRSKMKDFCKTEAKLIWQDERYKNRD